MSRLEVFWKTDLIFEVCSQCFDVYTNKGGAEAWGLLLGRKISDIEWEIEKIHSLEYMADYEPFQITPVDIGYKLTTLPKIVREFSKKRNIEVLGTYHSHPHECSRELYEFSPSRGDVETFQQYKFGINSIVYLVLVERCNEEQKDKLLTFGFADSGDRVAKAACYINCWSYDSPNRLPQKIPEMASTSFLVYCCNFSGKIWGILKPTVAGWYVDATSKRPKN